MEFKNFSEILNEISRFENLLKDGVTPIRLITNDILLISYNASNNEIWYKGLVLNSYNDNSYYDTEEQAIISAICYKNNKSEDMVGAMLKLGGLV